MNSNPLIELKDFVDSLPGSRIEIDPELYIRLDEAAADKNDAEVIAILQELICLADKVIVRQVAVNKTLREKRLKLTRALQESQLAGFDTD